MTFRAQHGGWQARAWYEGKRISATGPTKEIAAQTLAEGKSETYSDALDAANDFTVRTGNPNW